MSPIKIDYRTQYEAAEERIRELEADKLHDRRRIEELKAERNIMMDSARQLKERIARAKAILENWVDTGHAKEVLEALEGK